MERGDRMDFILQIYNLCNYIIDYLKDFNTISILIRLILTVILSGIIGVERSKIGRAAGLRTHVLVCLGATIASMTGLYISQITGVDADISRIAAQVVSGIGFLGAGTILIKNKSVITGLTTSACVWVTGTIGLAVGYGFYEGAIIGTILVFIITKKLGDFDKKLHAEAEGTVFYIEFKEASKFNETIDEIKQNNDIEITNINVFKTRTNIHNAIGAEIAFNVDDNFNSNLLMKNIKNIENVLLVISK